MKPLMASEWSSTMQLRQTWAQFDDSFIFFPPGGSDAEREVQRARRADRNLVVTTIMVSLAGKRSSQADFLTLASKFGRAGVKFNMTPNGEHKKNGPVRFCHGIKIWTPRHLCENPSTHTGVLGLVLAVLAVLAVGASTHQGGGTPSPSQSMVIGVTWEQNVFDAINA